MMESAMTIHMHYPAPSTISLLIIVLLWNFGRVCHPLLLLLFLLISPATAQHQEAMPPPPDPFAKLQFDKSMAIVLVTLIILFFILGFVSIYTRQCAERRVLGRLNLSIPIIGVNDSSRRTPRGLDQEIIDKFPTFVYSAVKSLKMGMATLECTVCLNEFIGDETLRLIPNCSHVFHSDCIDVWLATHSTCPVCRANLVLKPGDVSSLAIMIPDPRYSDSEETNDEARDLDELNRPVRSGFNIGNLFPRSHSTGHSPVRPGEDRERFKLRLPEEVPNQVVNNSGSTLSRTKSCGVMLQRESSWKMGYK